MKGPRLAVLAGFLSASALSGCEDQSYRDIRADILVVTERNDALVPQAAARLAARGRSTLTQIETALHIAGTEGRRRLIEILGRIGDPEAIFILRHVAVFDVDGPVRADAERVISTWAAALSPDAVQARQAQAWIAGKRAAGHGPIARKD